MRFFLSSPDFSISFENISKVQANLRSGRAEILENHQELLGLITNNLLEIEKVQDNRTERYAYVLADGMLTVLPKSRSEGNQTMVTLFAKSICSLHTSSVEDLKQKYDQKQAEFEAEEKKFQLTEEISVKQVLKTKLLILEQETEFAKQCLFFAKETKNTF